MVLSSIQKGKPQDSEVNPGGRRRPWRNMKIYASTLDLGPSGADELKIQLIRASSSAWRREETRRLIARMKIDVAELEVTKWLGSLHNFAPEGRVKGFAFIALTELSIKAQNAEHAKNLLSRLVHRTDFEDLALIARCSEYVEKLH